MFPWVSRLRRGEMRVGKLLLLVVGVEAVVNVPL
jgi:hypothetical protein